MLQKPLKRITLAALVAAFSTSSALANPPAPGGAGIQPLQVMVAGISGGKRIPPKFAYCRGDGKGRTKEANNISPAISWFSGPPGTMSYAILVVDKDVPANFEYANLPDQTIPVDYPRQDFYHWVLVDIPANIKGLLEAKNSNGVTEGGKPYGKTDYGINGQNDYSLVSPVGMHGGYDGPCPPWNDERLHIYHYTVYALDIPSLGLPNPVRGKQVEAAMAGHILAQGEATGSYTTNPKVKW